MKIQSYYYTWPGTQNNHAGMAYFARCLKKSFKSEMGIYDNSPDNTKLFSSAKQHARFFMPFTKGVFLMEYLTDIGMADHARLARSIRKWGYKKPIAGLVHLPEMLIAEKWDNEYITSMLNLLDYIVVYGSSLTEYLTRLGYGAKVRQTFHYVDTEFYFPSPDKSRGNRPLKVISFGTLLRDTQLLKEIVEACPDIQFDICSGVGNFKSAFDKLPHVKVHGYMPEEDLRNLLQQNDVSLSVMIDTIGSNSIVGGLACGLPQVVSDVGSIRDYCTTENAFFCKLKGDYVEALNKLNNDKALLEKMSINARQQAEGFAIDRSVAWFKEFFAEMLHK